MSLFSRIRDYFRPAEPTHPTALRNKPGGMAYIKSGGECPGAEVLVGRFVTTVRLTDSGLWEISPVLTFRLTGDYRSSDGKIRKAGALVDALAICDSLLEPLRNPGNEERDESLAWLPPVPKPQKEPA